jgi:hypothetical protein
VWVDAAGRRTYSDVPPPKSIPEDRILVRPGTSVTAAGASAPAAEGGESGSAGITAANDPTLEAAKKKIEAAAKAASAASAAARAASAAADKQRITDAKDKNCKAARSQLAMLNSGTRVSQFNEKGERVVLDDAGRAREIAEATSVAERNCQ